MDDAARLALEEYARPFMVAEIGHDYKHIDRVRKWALRIARAEGFDDLDSVEAAGLLHDIGLRDGGRKRHAETGAELAARFLPGLGVFSAGQIESISNAIRFHASLNGSGPVLDILQDADCMELFGAVGIMRALTSLADKPEYDPADVKGETWGAGPDVFTARFRAGTGVGRCLTDQLNFQISCYGNLHTETAKRLAAPLVDYMRGYMLQLEAEVGFE